MEKNTAPRFSIYIEGTVLVAVLTIWGIV